MQLRRMLLVLATTLAAPLALAGPALAGSTAVEVGMVEGNVVVGSTIGLAANTTISRESDNFVVVDPGGVDALPGCFQATATRASCSSVGIIAVSFVGRGPGFDRVLIAAGLGLRASANGGAGNDRLVSASTGDDLFGEAGNDMLLGNGGNDRMYGGTGSDTTRGGQGSDRHEGGDGNDLLDERYTGGNDFFLGQNGDDVLRGKGDIGFSDRLFGGAGMDAGSYDPSTDMASSVETLF